MATTNFTVSWDSTLDTRIINGICLSHNYQSLLDDGSVNPETKVNFAKRMLREWIKNNVRIAEIQVASTNAANTASNNIDSQIVIS